MSITRTPIQIILVEQLFNSVLLMIALVCHMYYGPILLAKLTNFSSEASTYIFIGGLLIPMFSWFYLWLPYTSVRIWRSTNEHKKGSTGYFYKVYSGLVFLILVISGLSALPALPEIIQELRVQ